MSNDVAITDEPIQEIDPITKAYWDNIKDFNELYGAVLIDGKLKIVYIDNDQINYCSVLKMADKGAILEFLSNKLIAKLNKDGHKIHVPIFREWFQYQYRRNYEGIIFRCFDSCCK